MTTPCLPGLFTDERPPAPQRVTMAPSAIESRRSGLRAARAKGTPQMLAYRALLERRGPMTDQDAANALGWPLSTVNGRRNDWINMRRGSVVDRGRVAIIHPDGSRTSRSYRSIGGRATGNFHPAISPPSPRTLPSKS